MTPIFVFVSGAALLIFSAEKLIGYLVGMATSLNISLFLLAIVFTGIEFDDVFLGVALNIEDLDGVALGTVFGATLSLIGVVLALAAILAPSAIQIPRDYVALFAIAPLAMIGFTLMGSLTAVAGAVLLALFVLFSVYVAARELGGQKAIFRDAEMYEDHPAVRAAGDQRVAGDQRTVVRPSKVYAAGADAGRGRQPIVEGEQSTAGDMALGEKRRRSFPAELGLAVLAVIGLVIGSATLGIGTEGILDAYGLEGTVFGATIATAVLTIEDVFLTVEPARRGVPEIAVGNVVGSVVFSVTGKMGIILLTGGLVVGPYVLTWHLPALVVATGLAAYFPSTGELRRWHGYTLLGLYVLYWIVSFVVVGGPPVDAS